MTYMLDTNICIYAMKNKPEHVLQRLKKELNSGICISSITLAELEYGMKHSSNPAKKRAGAASFPDSIEHPSFRSCSSFGIRRDPILSTG